MSVSGGEVLGRDGDVLQGAGRYRVVAGVGTGTADVAARRLFLAAGVPLHKSLIVEVAHGVS